MNKNTSNCIITNNIFKMEIWKKYSSYDETSKFRYLEFSNLGNVRGIFRDKQVEVEIKKDGRRCVGDTPIYVLVDRVFRGELPQGYVIHHEDFNKLNDSLDNLVRMTISHHMHIHTSSNNYGGMEENKFIWITNGTDNLFVEKGSVYPEGYSEGRTFNAKLLWFNNGIKNSRFATDEEAFAKGYLFKGMLKK